MRSLPAFFADIPDPRRRQGRRHSLASVLAICAAAVLCGMRGYKAISQWTEDLSQQARARFRCRYRNDCYEVPSRTVIRDLLMRVDAAHLDGALRGWNSQYAEEDEGLAIDGKTMRGTFDQQGRQIHILGLVGHQTQRSYTQKKSAPCP